MSTQFARDLALMRQFSRQCCKSIGSASFAYLGLQ